MKKSYLKPTIEEAKLTLQVGVMSSTPVEPTNVGGRENDFNAPSRLYM